MSTARGSETHGVTPPVDLTTIILDHLKRAAQAHGAYEADELAGVYDKQWPEWYAAHMSGTLANEGYSLTQADR